MIRGSPSTESDARRVVRLAQDATARLRALRRLRLVPSTRDDRADLERWWAGCHETRREVQLHDLSAGSLQQISDDLRQARAPSADVVFDLDVNVGGAVVSIACEARAAWTAEAVTGFLEVLAKVTSLAGNAATIVFVDEHHEPLAERDQERFGAVLRSRRAADVSI